MTAMQHVCVWQATEDERFQVCGDEECPIWRWSPAYSERAATEAHRRVGPAAAIVDEIAGRMTIPAAAGDPAPFVKPEMGLGGPETAICGPNGSEMTNDARPTEGMTA